MKLFSVVLIAGLILFTACGNSTQQPTPNQLTGNWNFTAKSSPYSYSYSGKATIQEVNNSVNGTMILEGSPCGTTMSLIGVVVGNNLTLSELSVPNDEAVSSLAGVIEKDGSISGTYTSPDSGCTNGDFGTWTATKGGGGGGAGSVPTGSFAFMQGNADGTFLMQAMIGTFTGTTFTATALKDSSGNPLQDGFYSIVLSPDGKTILFVTSGIYTANLDGSNIHT